MNNLDCLEYFYHYIGIHHNECEICGDNFEEEGEYCQECKEMLQIEKNIDNFLCEFAEETEIEFYHLCEIEYYIDENETKTTYRVFYQLEDMFASVNMNDILNGPYNFGYGLYEIPKDFFIWSLQYRDYVEFRGISRNMHIYQIQLLYPIQNYE